MYVCMRVPALGLASVSLSKISKEVHSYICKSRHMHILKYTGSKWQVGEKTMRKITTHSLSLLFVVALQCHIQYFLYLTCTQKMRQSLQALTWQSLALFQSEVTVNSNSWCQDRWCQLCWWLCPVAEVSHRARALVSGSVSCKHPSTHKGTCMHTRPRSWLYCL